MHQVFAAAFTVGHCRRLIGNRSGASFSSTSISALTLRKSADAQRFTASSTAGSTRKANGVRSGPRGVPGRP